VNKMIDGVYGIRVVLRIFFLI